MRKLLSIILASATLAACAQIPESIDNNSKAAPLQTQPTIQTESEAPSEPLPEVSEIERTVSGKDFERCVIQSASVIANGSYDNFVIDKDFTVLAGAFPSQMRVCITDDFDKSADKIFKKFLGDDEYERSKVTEHTDSGTGVKTLKFSGEKKQGSVSSDGSVSIVEKEYLNKSDYGMHCRVNETKCFANSSSDDTVSLGTVSLKLGDIKKTAEQTLSDFSAVIDGKDEFRPFKVSTVTEQNGEVLAFVHCVRNIGGVGVFDTVPLLNGQFLQMPVLFGPVLAINSKSRVVRMNFSKCLSVLSSEKPDDILTPEFAFKTASENLPEDLKLTARFEELVYIPTAEQKDEKQRSVVSQGDMLTLTPYWVIHFETDKWSEIYTAVNAVTGEVIYVKNRA